MTEPPARRDNDDDEPMPDFAQLFSEMMSGGEYGPMLEQLKAAGIEIPTDPATLQQLFTQAQQMMASTGDDAVNWDLATDTARKVAAASGDSTVGAAAARACVEALRLSELWLDEVTEMPGTGGREQAWSRAEWVQATLPTWQRLTVPVAESVSQAVADAMSQQVPADMQGLLSQASSMLRKLGGSMFGAQVGHAVGTLAAEVLSGTEIGLPLAGHTTRALVPANIDAFGNGLDVPMEEIRLFLALRESAHARLFAHAPWLGPRLLGAVEEYARGIRVDTAAIEEALRDVDPSNPAALQEKLSGGLFDPPRGPEQDAALARLETTLALLEGWVDVVTIQAATSHLPNAERLGEAMRRRRAVGGPAEQTFASLVGLQLRPRRLRDAATLWRTIAEQHGPSAREEIWQHPDLLPTTEDLDDPIGYAQSYAQTGNASGDVDEALRKILDGADATEQAADDTGQAADDTGQAGGDSGRDEPEN
ncbi:MAG: zinc-dependent metalloprotease [Micrococcales bacterium]|nr:MAG: zinc-dependent metalloprotease [Micrococcales bacterium]PIE26167.1 MAG: zinc-dependent metalloprotease [Micrococcales bacterium]